MYEEVLDISCYCHSLVREIIPQFVMKSRLKYCYISNVPGFLHPGTSEKMLFKRLLLQEFLQQGLRVVCEFGGIVKHAGAEQGGVDNLPGQELGKLSIF